MFHKLKDPISALTHMIAAILCIPVTILLIVKAVRFETMSHVVSFTIFGIALILLYTASTVYHSVNISEKVSLLLKRIDHMMIFVLIAGSYTPICLIPLRGVWGYSILITIWTIALIGILLKIFWIQAPRKVSSIIYILMGWLVIIAFVPLVKNLSPGGMALLTIGGIIYTMGGIIYALKWPKINFKYFGFHELFHLFVMGGSCFHIVMMFLYI